jgi:hypothetical protein
VAVWAALIVVGCGRVIGYARTTGDPGAPSETWPSGTRVPRSGTTATLVMFAHPRCPCTRASIAELARIMTACEGRVRSHVLFLLPDGMGEDWVRTARWDEAVAIPGVEVLEDPAGKEALSFGAATSGQVCVFAPDGRLLFTGGVTPSRGHEGGNAGRDRACAAILTGGPAPSAPVFGCALHEPAEATP